MKQRRHIQNRSRVFAHFAPNFYWSGRSGSIFFLVMASLVLLVSLARPQATDGLRTGAADLLTPVFSIVSQPFVTAAAFVSDVSGVTQMRAEISQLKSENDRLREWYQTALMLQSENQSLQALLNLKLEPQNRFITTRVVADSGNAFVKSVLVAAGTNDGVEKGQAVLAEDGMIGRIIEAGQTSSRVLLLTDFNSRVPILVEGSRQKAIVAGTNEELPQLTHLPSDSEIEEGARVVTSGHGGIFPPGLPIGRVVKSEGGVVGVKPFADMNRVNYVRIVDAPQDPNLRRGILSVPPAAVSPALDFDDASR